MLQQNTTENERVEVLVRASTKLSLARTLLRFARTKPLGAIGAAITITLILIAVLAPVISPADPYKTNASNVYATPGGDFILGSDDVGRDVMSRLFFGARVSLYVGMVSVAVGISLGTLIGVLSGFIGGKLDLGFQRIVDSFIAFPTIILALAIMAALGSSLNNVIIALIFVLAPGTARTIRSQVLSIRELDYVLAARAIGAPSSRIVLRHILPNIAAMYIILVTIQLGLAITTEASLSFLGVGVPPDVPSWGGMLTVAAESFHGVAPWLAIFPGVAIALSVFGVNLLGDALRDVLDPKLRGR